MTTRALTAIGVDPIQWRVLVLTALRVDMRTGGAVLQARGGRGGVASRGAGTFMGLLVSYAVMGGLFGALLWLVPNRFFAISLLFTFVIFSIGSSLLLEFHSIVLSPDDYRLLAYHPVSSRTFFAARLTSVLVYVWAMAFSLGLLPLLASAFASWGGLRIALAVLVALIIASTTTAFWTIGTYVWLAQRVPVTKLRRTLSYLQLVLTFVLYGSYFGLPRLLHEPQMLDRAFPADGWFLANPGSWFAAYVQMALGVALPIHVALAALTIVILIGGVWLSAGRVSLDYADRLALLMTSPSGTSGGAVASAASSASSPSRDSWLWTWFAEGERRALALVVRGLFRHDMKFRLGVLGILPLTVIYLLGGTRSHAVTDPFTQSAGSDPQLFYFAVLVFPSMLKQALSRSDAWRASWIFYSSPVEPSRLVLALNEFIVIYFVVPYLLLVGVLLAFFIPNWGHVAVLLVTLGLLSHINLLTEVCVSPQLPFTQPATRGSHARNVIVMIVLVTFVGALLPAMLHQAFATPLRIGLTLAALVSVNAALMLLAVHRVRRHVAVAEVSY